MKKKKLGLNKKVIASLSDIQKSKIVGGDDAYTTSFSDCTHFLCCPDDCEDTKDTDCDQNTCGECPPDDSLTPLCPSNFPACPA
jgi:hypothetical protein